MSESFADITFGDGEVIKATRRNTVLYRHFGKLALYDHIWVERGEAGHGGFIWAQHPPNNQAFETLAAVAVKHGIEMRLNLRKVAEGDLNAFRRAALGDIDEVPNWLPEI